MNDFHTIYVIIVMICLCAVVHMPWSSGLLATAKHYNCRHIPSIHCACLQKSYVLREYLSNNKYFRQQQKPTCRLHRFPALHISEYRNWCSWIYLCKAHMLAAYFAL